MIVVAIDSLIRMVNEDFVLQAVYQIFYLSWLVFAFYLNAIIVKNYNFENNVKFIFYPSFKKDY
jgi:hypothetical protein